MSGPVERPVHVAWAMAADRAAAVAIAEAVRLEAEIGLALSALSAIEDRARELSDASARVRSIGFEFLPRSYYLAHCVTALRHELDSARPLRRSARRARSRAEEIEGLLGRVVELTATVDVPGELDLPLELVSVTQTGARAGLACLARLHDMLDSVERAPRVRPDTSVRGPSRPASALVGAAGRLLPAASRSRYTEEFRSELLALAESGGGTRTQLAHAMRQVAVLWSLRRALPSTGSATDAAPGRSRTTLSTAPGRSRRRGWVAAAVGSVLRRIDNWEARMILRAQARVQRGEPEVRPPGHTADARRGRIPVRRRRR